MVFQTTSHSVRQPYHARRGNTILTRTVAHTPFPFVEILGCMVYYITTDVLNLLECNIENDLEIGFFTPLLGMGDAAKCLSVVYLDNRRFES